MKLALAHEYFAARGGAERVVDGLHASGPEAPVYTFFHDAGVRRASGRGHAHELPAAVPDRRRGPPVLLPLYPSAARRMRSGRSDRCRPRIDEARSSKDSRAPERTVEVAYCHSPTRFPLGLRDEYLRGGCQHRSAARSARLLTRLAGPVRAFAKARGSRDAKLAGRRRAFRRYYESESDVVHQPIDVDAFTPQRERGDFWSTSGRLSAYKRATSQCARSRTMGMRRHRGGRRRERARSRRSLAIKVAFAGRSTMRRCTSCSVLPLADLPREDDFGIVCVERVIRCAVVALAAGGAPEIVRDGIRRGTSRDPRHADGTEAVLRVEHPDVGCTGAAQIRAPIDVARFRDRIHSRDR